jgi:hypothetical protein
MSNRLLLTALMLLVLTSVALAERVEFGPVANDVDVAVLESSEQKVVVRFDVGAFDKETVDINNETYYSLTCGDENQMLNAEEPAVPRICRSIIIPDDARMDVKIISADYIDFPQTPVIPSKGSIPRTILPSDVPYKFGPVYNEDAFYPGVIADIREPFIFRDYRGTVIEMNAFQYNPVSQTLRVYTSVTLEVVNTGPGEVNVLHRNKSEIHLVDEFDRLYSHNFINYDQMRGKYPSVPEIGDMLIITYDSFHSSVMPLVEWKLQKGIKTTIVDVSSIGTSASTIHSFIGDFYDTTNLAFVLLVGDGGQIPTLYSNGDSDPSYGKLLGGDNYPEILVGRFSAENITQTETQVLRSINYEKTPYGTDWYQKATGIGSSGGPGDDGEYDWEHEDNIRALLLAYGFTYVDQIYDPGATASMVTTAINDGRSWVNYTGHGSTNAWSTTGFSSSNVNALVNDWMLPTIISVACVNGDFVGTTCFAEAWLRATHNGTPTGAIATYMSTINQDWNEPMEGQDAINDLLVTEAKTTVGGLLVNGGCQMLETYGSAGVDDFDTWTIFGDPSIPVRVKNPMTLTVNHDNAIIFTMPDMSVEVPGIEGALCAVYSEGTLYGSAYTDASGMATIGFDQDLPVGGTVTLTVTAYHYTPYIATIQAIAPEGPFVIYDDNDIDDVAGNDDGIINCGETISLGVQLTNVGPDTAYSVTAVLSTDDPLIDITDNTESYGTIPGEFGIVNLADAFSFDVSDEFPNDQVIVFNLLVSDLDTSWSSSFNITGHCYPEITLPAEIVDSMFLGESSIIDMTVHNNGKASLEASFSASDNWISVPTAQQTVPAYDSVTIPVTINSANLDYGNFTGYVNYTTNDPQNLSGAVPVYLHIYSPDIYIAQTSIEESVEPEGQSSVPLTVQNVGPGPLEFNVVRLMFNGKGRTDPVKEVAPQPIGYRAADPEKSTTNESEPFFAPVTRDNGGPDLWGYSWVDSDDPAGPDYGWIDISSVGTALTLGDDTATSAIAIGFDFPFYENFYNELYIGSNGIITFGDSSKQRTNTVIPNDAIPNNMIAMWWDDLDPRKGGMVYYYYDATNERFIVSFDGIANYYSTTGTGSVHFQAILTPNGKILLQYGSMDPGVDADGLAGSTIGIENALGDDGLQVVCNAEYIHNDMAILFNAASWLSVDPGSGSIDPYSDAVINVNFDATELPEGDFNGQITFNSNDPDTPELDIPVTMTVLNQTAPPPAPAMVGPEDGATDLPQPITINWNSVSGVDMYQMQLDSSATFSGVKMMDTSMAGTHCDVDNLDEGETYYWRVRAHNSIGWGDWSATWSFTTEITWICGDFNGDGELNIFDVTGTIAFLYTEGDPPAVEDAADVNNDGTINIFDAAYMIDFLYQEGPAPDCP